MAKIKLNLPETFVFQTELTVRINDVNYGGHLGNDAILTLAQEARLRFLKKYAFSEIDVYGASLIQADAVIVYKAQAFYGDQLKIEVALGDFSNTSFDFFYLITNRTTEKEVARVKTRLVFFDYQRGKTLAVPEAFREQFA